MIPVDIGEHHLTRAFGPGDFPVVTFSLGESYLIVIQALYVGDLLPVNLDEAHRIGTDAKLTTEQMFYLTGDFVAVIEGNDVSLSVANRSLACSTEYQQRYRQ